MFIINQYVQQESVKLKLHYQLYSYIFRQWYYAITIATVQFYFMHISSTWYHVCEDDGDQNYTFPPTAQRQLH